MTPRFIRHITLQSGHVRDSFAGEVKTDALVFCQHLIDQCLERDGQRIPITLPGTEDYSLLAGRAPGRSLVGSVWHCDEAPVALVNFAVAVKSRPGSRIWRRLHEFSTVPAATDSDRCPTEPWIAVSLEPDIVNHADALEWLGDFERCLAWAWISGRSQTEPGLGLGRI
jgi:hypothetical protein